MTAFRICSSPVVTDPRKAVVALKWAVREMEERYRKMSKLGVRGVEAFNDRVRKAKEKGESPQAHGADGLRPRDRQADL